MTVLAFVTIIFIGYFTVWPHHYSQPKKLESKDQVVNAAYDIVLGEFNRQLALLDSLGYFENLDPNAPVCGCGCGGDGTKECYKLLGKLLPEATKKLVASGRMDDTPAPIVIVTPRTVVPLKYQWSKMSAGGYRFQDDLSVYTNQDVERSPWEDGRASFSRPYLLVGITAGDFCRTSSKPTDSTMAPCDQWRKGLTLAEATALLTMYPELAVTNVGTIAAGSLYSSGMQKFPFLLNLTGLPNRVYRLDIFSPEMQERYPDEVWAPEVTARMSLEK